MISVFTATNPTTNKHHFLHVILQWLSTRSVSCSCLTSIHSLKHISDYVLFWLKKKILQWSSRYKLKLFKYAYYTLIGRLCLPFQIHFNRQKANAAATTMTVCVCVFSCVWPFVTSWTAACQALLSMEVFRQEYRCGLPFPTPGESSWPGGKIWVSFISCPGRQFLYHWATWGDLVLWLLLLLIMVIMIAATI